MSITNSIPVLNCGNLQVPAISYGTYKLFGEDVYQPTLEALATGYRYIDTAALYRNEFHIGKAIKDSGIPRDQIIIQSKAWVNGNNRKYLKQHLQRALDLLQLDYIDIYLLHQPYFDVYGAWEEMIKLKEEGLIKEIAVSNFTPILVENLYHFTGIKPSLNQIEFSPLYQRANVLDYYKSREILVQAWSPIARGEQNILQHPILIQIAKELNCSTVQVITRWLLDQGVSLTLKATSSAHLKNNLKILQQPLTPLHHQLITQLNQGHTQSVSHQNPIIMEKMDGYTPLVEEYYAQFNKELPTFLRNK